MNEIRKEFDKYRTEKRIEISSMTTIVQNLGDEITDKEKDLLIRSYIVLTYAYWESSYHKLQEYLFKVYQEIPIANLPHELKNKVYLKLISEHSGIQRTKAIKDISNHTFFDNLHLNMHKNETETVSTLGSDNYKFIFISKTANPSINLFESLLRDYGFNLTKIIKGNSEIGNLDSYLVKGIEFLIKQRNAIAHKNEHISYNEITYEDYSSCIKAFEEQNDMNSKPAEEFIKELGFQIDSFFRVVLNEVETKNKERDMLENV